MLSMWQAGIAVWLDPVGMLDAQGVVDLLLLELGVRVDFVRHRNGSVKAQSGAGRRYL
jgi:cell envelope opacity-associated protein A